MTTPPQPPSSGDPTPDQPYQPPGPPPAGQPGGQPPYQPPAGQPPYQPPGPPPAGQPGGQPPYQPPGPPPPGPPGGGPGGQPPYQPPPPPSPGTAIPVRQLTVWALLLLAAAIIFFAFVSWIFPAFSGDVLGRFNVGSFTHILVLVPPLLAVLVATRVGPMLSEAKLVGLIALAEYAVALLLGIVAFLITIATRFDGLGSGIYAFGGVLQGLGGILIDLLLLALLALAGLWTYQIFSGLGGSLPKMNIRTY